MLRVGVTGGIGSGKSTVSRRLGELGAHVVDADAVAREVVEPGEPALQRIRERFGQGVVRPDGSLDRAGLAALVFPDRVALDALDAITGPAISARVAELRAAAPRSGISVYDMPLLVERGLWVHEHLSVVVETDVETRVRRLVDQRGLAEQDVRHRIAAQATDEQRRAVADVVLDNSGAPEELVRAVDDLWATRLEPYAANLVHGTRSRRPERAADVVVGPRADWEPRAERVVARLAAALAPTGVVTEVSHIGSTSVPGLLAKDVIDVQVGVHRLVDADRDDVRRALADAGFVFAHGVHSDTPHPLGSDPEDWVKRFLGGCDPENNVNVHVREKGSAGWRFALLFRDWLRHEAPEKEAYAAEKRRLLALHDTTSDYVEAKEPWFEGAWQRASDWAARTGWQPR
ncbi:dephospho-CoA kinase [Terrabacter aerolatus]|uniref:Dephospho-CoA kinase n=1 Tax=Terrabacter aerolatus TaxID=422442 RepID=A0A512D470_9MICO|nr:dephospho-CoA kinase [Terrabacter aerolatus]GEO31263.1 dephospho-CoA kinase [Terrabacter aerolatus]